MRTLSPESEARLLNATRQVVDLTDGGMSPTQAVVKVAGELRLPPGFVPLVCQAYNIGRQTVQRESHDNVLDKFASFELADSAAALAELYPEKPQPAGKIAVAEVVDPCYSRPAKLLAGMLPERRSAAPTEKTAEAKGTGLIGVVSRPDPAETYLDDLANCRREKLAVEELRRQSVELQDKFLEKLAQLRRYFQQAPTARRPFGEVHKRAELLWGDLGRKTLAVVATPTLRKEAAPQGLPPPLDRQQSPYRELVEAIKTAQQLLRTRAAYLERRLPCETKYAELVPLFDAALTPTTAAAGPEDPPINILEKRSLGLVDYLLASGLKDSAKGLLGKAYGSTEAGKPTQQLVEDRLGELEDPAHDAELRKIHAEAMLHDLLTNDEVIRGYEPVQVLRAYNELSQLHPRGATSAAIMRPLLRQQLTRGSMEPFEAHEVAKLENTLAGSKKLMPFPYSPVPPKPQQHAPAH